jgi:hypothetical protein
LRTAAAFSAASGPYEIALTQIIAQLTTP